MSTALIGYTGFVGGNLAACHTFDDFYNSKNIAAIQGREYDLIVCAGVQAVKWWANQNAAEDWSKIGSLLEPLRSVKASRFVLMSSVDVYPPPVQGDELTAPRPSEPYGLHRLKVEEWIADHFPVHNILRLPGLFGDGLKKNVIYDL